VRTAFWSLLVCINYWAGQGLYDGLIFTQ